MATPKVLFLMADYGHDPTEVAIPYAAFKEAGFDVSFATESGKSPDADEKMLSGTTQMLLGASKAACDAYRTMKDDAAIKTPLAWSDSVFSLSSFDLLFFPGGHDKSVRQVIEAQSLRHQIAEYFPQTRKPSRKSIAAICHGVLVLSEASYADGKSLLHDVTTTTLPSTFEATAYWGTKMWLGDYYKTYGAGSENTETTVKKRLDDPYKQWRSSLGLSPFIVQDEKYNYISGRFPADAALLATKTIELVKANMTVA